MRGPILTIEYHPLQRGESNFHGPEFSQHDIVRQSTGRHDLIRPRRGLGTGPALQS